MNSCKQAPLGLATERLRDPPSLWDARLPRGHDDAIRQLSVLHRREAVLNGEHRRAWLKAHGMLHLLPGLGVAPGKLLGDCEIAMPGRIVGPAFSDLLED